MVMTLSDRFDKIDANRVVVKPVMNTGAAQRRDDMDSRRKVGRQTQFEARRQGVTNAKPAMRAAQAKTVAPRQVQQVQMQRPSQIQGRLQGRGFSGGRNQQKMAGRGRTGPVARGVTAGRGPGRGGRQQVGRVRGAAGAAGRGRGRGRGGRQGGRGNKDDKSEQKDLDEGLDEYWFKAGKGPDPKVASLDRGLDNYWNMKNAAPGAGDAGKSEDKAAEDGVEMSDVAAPAAEVDPDL